MDEVPTKAGRKSKGKMQQTYFWPIFGEHGEIVFTWSRSRGHKHVLEQLKDFSGTLITDGYSAYDTAVKTLNENEKKITASACWVHTRRKFEAALKHEPKAAQHALNQIAKLYQLEKHAREKERAADKHATMRQEKSEPIVNDFFKWVYEQRQRADLLPTNPLTKALTYASNLQEKLRIFLSNPNVPLDTNHLERALRVIPMGRKNWLFCWTELGAEQLGILQSLMVTCRLHDINPYTYLVDVLQRVSQHPASNVIELTPREWKARFSDNPLKSVLSNKPDQ